MTEKQLSQFMKDQAGGLMSKFNPLNLARGLFGSNKAGSKTGDVIGTDRQKLKAAVSKGKDPEFTTIGSSDRTSVRRGDSVANIAAKMYNLINRDYNNTKKESNIENKLAKTLSIKKEKRHKELLAALTAAPKQKGVELKVPKKEENKMPTVTQPSVTPKPSAPTGATPKPVTPQAAPKPTPGQPVTAAPKPAPTAAPKPTPGQPMAAPKPAPSVAGPKPTPTKPPVTAAPKPPTTATPAVPPTPPAAVQATPAVSTATKVAVGAALATTATASFAAGPLAENIVAHESKVSSPLSRDGRKMATKWKNNTEYNAYNKGTKIAADFDEKGESVIDFSKMTIEEYLKRGAIKDPKNPKKIFAMGRYQIIPSTMEYLVKELKIDPKTTYLTKETQDYLFMAGLVGKKRKKVKAYIDGDPKVTRDQAILELSQEFASIGVPYDVKVKGKLIKKGQSYYGQNTKSGFALNPPEEVGKALDAERAKSAKQDQKTPSNVPEKGKEVDKKSLENKDLKKQSSATQNSIMINQNTTIAAAPKSTNVMTMPRSDASSFVRGAQQ